MGDKSLIIEGPTASGKSSRIEILARQKQKRLIRILLVSIGLDDFIGSYVLEGKQPVFRYNLYVT